MSPFIGCGGALPAVAPDPRKRVNFVQGLVLGADDLTQESAYLAGRVEWLAREVIGFGTIAGLRVTREILPGRGVGLLVGAGTALTPDGRPITVAMPQAVALDEWLESRREDLLYHVVPGFESPPGDLLRLFLVLSYTQCSTDDTPGPGEPCRGDEPLPLFTRLADDFRLELRLAAPDQSQEDAVRDLGAWLRSLEVVDSPVGAVTLDELLDSLRAAAALASPPQPIASPPEPLRLFRDDAVEFLRAAWRTWVTELRWPARTAAAVDDALLLAEVDVPLTYAADGRWRVDADAPLAIREDRRPFVLSLRMVLELALALADLRAVTEMGTAPATGLAAPPPAPSAPSPAPTVVAAAAPVSVVAAGVIKGSTKRSTYRAPVFNDLRVLNATAGELLIHFGGYTLPQADDEFQYVVKVLAPAIPDNPDAEPATEATPLVANLLAFEEKGIRLLVMTARGERVPAKVMATLDFCIEVSEYRP